jgi:teichuronic acid exporter
MSEPTESVPAPDVTNAGPLDEEEALDHHVSPTRSIELKGGRTLRAHAAQGLVINSLFQIGLTGVGLLRNVGIAAFLTRSQYGIWGLIVATLVTLSRLKQVGIDDKYVQQDETNQELAFQKAFTLELCYSGMFYGFIVAALPVYALIYGHYEIILPGAIAALGLLTSALQAPIWIAYRQMRFVRQRTLESIDPVVTLGVTLALGVAGFGYWSLVIGNLVGSSASAVAAVSTSPYRIALRYDSGTLRQYFHFSWPLFISAASGLAMVQAAMIVGNYTVGLAGIGAIGLAGTIAAFGDRVDTIVRQTIYPAVCAVRERRDLLLETFVKSNRLGVLFGLTFGIGLALFAPDLVKYVLGERWEPATGLIQAFGLIIGFRQIAYNWTVFVRALGDNRPLAWNSVLVVVTFLAVGIPLMFSYGLTGFAIGTAVSLAVDIATRAYFLARIFPGFQMAHHFYRSVLPHVFPTVAVLAARGLIDAPRTTGTILLDLLAYLMLTAAAAYVLERPLINEILGYVRGGRRPLVAA